MASSRQVDLEPVAGRLPGWAWGLCWLMFASTVLNYMDRQSMALVSPQVRREFGIDFEGFGWVLTAFGLSYALFQIPAGLLVDRFDVRRLYAGAVALWSAAAMASAFSPTLGVLIGLRALLGVGEAFNWPCALRVTGAVLPARDRSLGNGIFNSGAAIGAVLTPLTVPLLAYWFGWRIAFLMIGSIGFVWVIVWLLCTRGRLPASISGASPGASKQAPGWVARLAFGLVVALALAEVLLGTTLPAHVTLTTPQVTPAATPRVESWLVKAGEPIRRGVPLARLSVDQIRFDLTAPEDGRVLRYLVNEGESAHSGEPVGAFRDTIETRPLSWSTLRVFDPVELVGWRVGAGSDIEVGDVLGTVRIGTGRGDLVSSESGKLVRLLANPGQRLDTKTGVAELEVGGLHPRAGGLRSIWWGIATLLIGWLLAARIVPLEELGTGWARRVGEMVRMRRFWVLVCVTVTINVCWHFLVNWIPTYLQTDRAMAYLTGGLWSALPFLAADVGNLGGGALSRRLAQRGTNPARARLVVMSGCAVLISLGALVGWVPSGPGGQVLVLLFLALMALGAAAFMANYFAFCQEVSPRDTGLVVGYLGGLGNLFAAGFNPVAGHIKDTAGDFTLVFLVVGLIPFVGLMVLWLGWGLDRTGALDVGARLGS